MPFSVYPNPTSGSFTLQSGVAGKATVLALDGRVVIESKKEVGNTSISMSAGITPGIYLLRFTGDDGSTQTTRLIYQP